MDFKSKKCVPCEGGIEKLGAERVAELLAELPGWELRDEKICRRFDHDNFVQAMAFVNRMAEVAEAEGHHPDFCVHYSRVDVTIWTHAASGLTENDFILAAKIDALCPGG